MSKALLVGAILDSVSDYDVMAGDRKHPNFSLNTSIYICFYIMYINVPHELERLRCQQFMTLSDIITFVYRPSNH